MTTPLPTPAERYNAAVRAALDAYDKYLSYIERTMTPGRPRPVSTIHRGENNQ